ncbi:uncharacterized protein MELLADRAFT_65972 [Melampsora larici-populina 98AG31]|uniref:Uncharacterized protein n=1 Tax=Melampsora larici-populina (strain 98AG31 / pathotype 3-4-7) TaxID=747676 RepID=F4RXE6_MELLP|nr:uncharacterized protein MELLADRAFT_65972 [Melampsora larici-populina 98AG31]EGG02953.1 hypothetical protein MELLADRAFT_65972 [Melampsora larici-populina 98AG31]
MIGTDWLDSFNEYQGDDDEEEKEMGIRTRPVFPVSRQKDKSSATLSSSLNDTPQIYNQPSQPLSQSNNQTDCFEPEISDPIDIGQIEEGPQKDFIDNPWTIAHRRAIAQREKVPPNPIKSIEREDETYNTKRTTRRGSKSTTFLPLSRRGQIYRNQPGAESENVSSSLQNQSEFSQPPLNFSEEENEPEIEIIHQSDPKHNPYKKLRFDGETNHSKSSVEFGISNFGSDSMAVSETGTLLTHGRTTNTSGSAQGSELDMINPGVEQLNSREYIDVDDERRSRMMKTVPKLTRSQQQSKSHRKAKSILRPIKHLETTFNGVKAGHSINLSSPLVQHMNHIPSTTSTSTSTAQSNHLKPIKPHPALSALYMPSNTLNEFRSGRGKQVDDEEITPVIRSRAMKSQPNRRSSISKRRKLLKKNSGLENRLEQVGPSSPIDNIAKRSISKNKTIKMKETSKISKEKDKDNLGHVVRGHGLDSLTSESYGMMREMLEIQIRESDEWPSSDQVAEVLFGLAVP